jgi:hypothetical protein
MARSIVDYDKYMPIHTSLASAWVTVQTPPPIFHLWCLGPGIQAGLMGRV